METNGYETDGFYPSRNRNRTSGRPDQWLRRGVGPRNQGALCARDNRLAGWAGRGMGLARAGKLKHHPGPARVLVPKDKLALTPQQLAATMEALRG